MKQISVGLFTDSIDFNEKLARILQADNRLKLVGKANTQSASEMVKIEEPDIILFDENNGIPISNYLIRIKGEKRKWRLIFLVNSLESSTILEALRRGTRGYIEKKESCLQDYLGKAIRAVNGGEVWITRRMTAKLLEELIRLA